MKCKQRNRGLMKFLVDTFSRNGFTAIKSNNFTFSLSPSSPGNRTHPDPDSLLINIMKNKGDKEKIFQTKIISHSILYTSNSTLFLVKWFLRSTEPPQSTHVPMKAYLRITKHESFDFHLEQKIPWTFMFLVSIAIHFYFTVWALNCMS